jgi:hypothetical protein
MKIIGEDIDSNLEGDWCGFHNSRGANNNHLTCCFVIKHPKIPWCDKPIFTLIIFENLLNVED